MKHLQTNAFTLCSLACVIILSALNHSTHAATVPIDLHIEGERYDAVDGPGDTRRGEDVNVISGGWVEYQNIDFGNSMWDTLYLDFRNSRGEDMYQGGTLEARLDSKTGTLLATVTDITTYGKQVQRKAFALPEISGKHSLVIVGTGAPAGELVFAFDRAKFIGTYEYDPDAAATYYVDDAQGNDGNDGLTLQTAFKTIGKASSVMTPGSKCFIRRGIYRETIRPFYTGIPAAGITYEAYQGEEVYVSACERLTGWEKDEGNIYKAPMDWNFGKWNNQFFADGKMVFPASCPNISDPHRHSGYGEFQGDPSDGESISPLLIRPSIWADCPNGSKCQQDMDAISISDAETYYTQIRDPEPQDIPCILNKPADFFKGGLFHNWGAWYSVQAEIVGNEPMDPEAMATKGRVSKDRWPNITMKRTWHDEFPFIRGGDVVISHVKGLLDAPNEYYFDQDKGMVYMWIPSGDDPDNHMIEAKKRLRVVDLDSKSYITIKNIRFLGGSMTMANARHCIVNSCDFKYITHYAMATDKFQMITNSTQEMVDVKGGDRGIYMGGEHNRIENCLIAYSSGSGIIVDGNGHRITNNIFHTMNYIVSYDGAVFIYNTRKRGSVDGGLWGSDLQIMHNTFRGTGRSALYMHALSADYEQKPIRFGYNKLSVNGMRSAESASMYLATAPRNTEIDHNWFFDLNRAAIWQDFKGAPTRVHHNVFWRGNSIRNQDNPRALRGPISVQLAANNRMDPATLNKVYNNTILTVNRGASTGTFGTNFLFGTATELGLADSANYDFRPTKNSPAVDAGKREIILSYHRSVSVDDPLSGNGPDPTPTGCCEQHPADSYEGRAWTGPINTGVTVDDYVGDAPDLGAYEYGGERWVPGADWEEAQRLWNYPPGSTPAFRTDLYTGGHSLLGMGVRVNSLGLLVSSRDDKISVLRLLNAQGRLVVHAEVMPGETKLVPTKQMPAGAYLLSLKSGRSGITRRIVIP